MSDLADLRRALNPQQFEAVTHTEGPMLVFAGAGSGKTRVITHRAAHLVQHCGVSPWNVMCVTFTNKAAGEMRERCARLIGSHVSRDLWISTFHAAGARLLRQFHQPAGLRKDFAIYDDADQRSVIRRVYDDLKLTDDDLQPRAAQSMIDRWKQAVWTPDMALDAAKTDIDETAANVYANYEHRLAAANVVDFGDLLKRLVELLERDAETRAKLQDRIRYLMVDEFQDTNTAQYRIVRALVGPARNLCVVGDDDQAIYSWRGADARNLAMFRADFPDARVVLLEQNYRSTGRILAAANAVVRKLHKREEKKLFTTSGEGAPIATLEANDEREEAGIIALKIKAAHARGARLADHAVFYRINAQSRAIEEAMRAANLPYVVYGGMRFFERAEIKDALAYLRLLTNPQDDVSFLRVVNVPARGIGKTTLDRLMVLGSARKQSLWEVIAGDELPAELSTARKKLVEFRALIRDLQANTTTAGDRPSDILSAVLDATGYHQMLESSTEVDASSRIENLAELVGSMKQYERDETAPSLTGFLERVTLDDRAAADDEAAADRVVLMTVHSAKGLEFDTVFITGLEERMFPYRGVGPGESADDLEEERRLAYVAITRARRQLMLSWARSRQIFGTTRQDLPSRFVFEIPDEVLEHRIPRRESAYAPRSPAYARPPGGYYASTAGSGGSGRPPPGPAAAPSQGIHVEYDDGLEPHSTSDHGWKRGMRVKSAKYGVGRIEAIESGAELKLVVYFPGIPATKKLLADYVQPL